jgi:hypothetical protein
MRMPFGLYFGMKLSEIDDDAYLCRLNGIARGKLQREVERELRARRKAPAVGPALAEARLPMAEDSRTSRRTSTGYELIRDRCLAYAESVPDVVDGGTVLSNYGSEASALSPCHPTATFRPSPTSAEVPILRCWKTADGQGQVIEIPRRRTRRQQCSSR